MCDYFQLLTSSFTPAKCTFTLKLIVDIYMYTTNRYLYNCAHQVCIAYFEKAKFVGNFNIVIIMI